MAPKSPWRWTSEAVPNLNSYRWGPPLSKFQKRPWRHLKLGPAPVAPPCALRVAEGDWTPRWRPSSEFPTQAPMWPFRPPFSRSTWWGTWWFHDFPCKSWGNCWVKRKSHSTWSEKNLGTNFIDTIEMCCIRMLLSVLFSRHCFSWAISFVVWMSKVRKSSCHRNGKATILVSVQHLTAKLQPKSVSAEQNWDAKLKFLLCNGQHGTTKQTHGCNSLEVDATDGTSSFFVKPTNIKPYQNI